MDEVEGLTAIVVGGRPAIGRRTGAKVELDFRTGDDCLGVSAGCGLNSAVEQSRIVLACRYRREIEALSRFKAVGLVSFIGGCGLMDDGGRGKKTL